MKVPLKRRAWTIAGLGLVALAIVVVLVSTRRDTQPIYAGKPILAYFPVWISEAKLQKHSGLKVPFGTSKPVVISQMQMRFLFSNGMAPLQSAITPDAIPWLFAVIRREDGFLKRAYEKHQSKLPLRLQQMLPVPIPSDISRFEAQELLSTVVRANSSQAAPFILDALQRGSVRERLAAHQASVWLDNPPRTIPLAVAANLKHPDVQVRESALDALLPGFSENAHFLSDLIRRSLEVHSYEADEKVLRAIVDYWTDPQRRPTQNVRLAERFCQNMVRHGSRAAIALPALRDLRASENSLIRVEADYAVWQIEPSDLEAQRDLLKVVANISDQSRHRALECLAQGRPRLQLPSGEVVPAMKSVLRANNPHTGARAADVLSHYGPDALPALPELRALARDPDRRAREAAVAAIEAMGSSATDAIPTLIEALNDPITQLAAARCLGQFKSKAAEAAGKLVEILSDRSAVAGATPLREAAAKTLGQLNVTDAEVITALMNATGDSEPPAVRAAASYALKRLQRER